MLITPEEFEKLMEEINGQMFPPALSVNLMRFEFRPGGVAHPNLYQTHLEYFADNPQRRSLLRRAVKGEFDNIPYDSEDALCPETAENYPNLALQNPPQLSPFVKSIWKLVPPLWVLVTQLSKGFHQVSTVYRGNAFFPLCDYSFMRIGKFASDAELLDVVRTMNAREGIDQEAMKAFADHCYKKACGMIGKPKRSDSSSKWVH